MLQRQGSLTDEGTPARTRREPPSPKPPDKERRTRPLQFVREVRGELRKVAWPTRQEVINYSIIVLIALVILTSFVAAQDWFWNWGVFRLFGE
ncbi:MAG: preprotein translocase subunit SecE [Acidimicrobiales bacterium]